MKVVFVVACIAFALQVSAMRVPEAQFSISVPAPKTYLPINDMNAAWEPVQPTASLAMSNFMQEDEGTALQASSPESTTCTAETGCLCRHHFYFKHLDVNDCKVFVPESYHKPEFRCQYFVQGGYVFLYGDSWIKQSQGATETAATYYCKEDAEQTH